MDPVRDLLQKEKKESQQSDYLASIHHILMKTYGWIPVEEFKNLPVPMVVDLMDQIQLDIERENEAWKKAKKKRK
jgi:hypothetical protein